MEPNQRVEAFMEGFHDIYRSLSKMRIQSDFNPPEMSDMDVEL